MAAGDGAPDHPNAVMPDEEKGDAGAAAAAGAAPAAAAAADAKAMALGDQPEEEEADYVNVTYRDILVNFFVLGWTGCGAPPAAAAGGGVAMRWPTAPAAAARQSDTFAPHARAVAAALRQRWVRRCTPHSSQPPAALLAAAHLPCGAHS